MSLVRLTLDRLFSSGIIIDILVILENSPWPKQSSKPRNFLFIIEKVPEDVTFVQAYNNKNIFTVGNFHKDGLKMQQLGQKLVNLTEHPINLSKKYQ